MIVLCLQGSEALTFESVEVEESLIREQAKIFKKQKLTPYQQEINRASEDICVKNPAMLTQRGKLLEMARVHVDGSGYQYKKKRSRSKYFGGASEPTVKRPKFSKVLRMERINEIQEELKTIDKRIDIKKKLLNQKVGERKFGECDKISESIDELQGRQRTLSAELRTFEKKERQAQWYESKKSSACQTSGLASVSPPVYSPVRGRSLFDPMAV